MAAAWAQAPGPPISLQSSGPESREGVVVVKGLPGGSSGVGSGTAHAEASMEHGPSGRRFAVEGHVPEGQ